MLRSALNTWSYLSVTRQLCSSCRNRINASIICAKDTWEKYQNIWEQQMACMLFLITFCKNMKYLVLWKYFLVVPAHIYCEWLKINSINGGTKMIPIEKLVWEAVPAKVNSIKSYNSQEKYPTYQHFWKTSWLRLVNMAPWDRERDAASWNDTWGNPTSMCASITCETSLPQGQTLVQKPTFLPYRQGTKAPARNPDHTEKVSHLMCRRPKGIILDTAAINPYILWNSF